MISWLLILLRVLIGILVMKTGADLIQGESPFTATAVHQPILTGLFILLVGIHIIFASTLNRD